MTAPNRPDHIRLTSHPDPEAKARFPIQWGAGSPRERGPVIGTVSKLGARNVIGSHGGSYAVYRALAVSAGALDPIRRPEAKPDPWFLYPIGPPGLAQAAFARVFDRQPAP